MPLPERLENTLLINCFIPMPLLSLFIYCFRLRFPHYTEMFPSARLRSISSLRFFFSFFSQCFFTLNVNGKTKCIGRFMIWWHNVRMVVITTFRVYVFFHSLSNNAWLARWFNGKSEDIFNTNKVWHNILLH